MSSRRPEGLGKPYVRGDGRWVVPFRTPGGKRIKLAVRRDVNVTTERAAIEWAFAEILKKRMNGALEQVGPALPKHRGPTIRETADEWLGLRKADADIAGATYDSNEAQMRLHVLPVFGDVPVSMVNEPEMKAKLAGWVRDFRAKRGEDGRQTVRNVFSTFRLFLDWCQSPESRCELAENPLRSEWAKRLLPKRRKTEARFAMLDGPPLSPEQIQKVLDNPEVELRWRARIALVFTSPMRDGEIAGLKIEDVNLDADIPFADVKKACVLNHKDGYAKIGKVKKEWSNRKLPLHAAAKAAIEAWIAEGWEEFVGRQPRPSDPLFPRDDGGFARPASADALRDALATSGVPTTVADTPIVFHDSRGCVATWLKNASVADSLIRRFLGQAPVGAAEEKYFKGNLLAPMVEAQRVIPLVWKKI